MTRIGLLRDIFIDDGKAMQTYVSVKSHYVSYLLTGAMLRAMDVKHERYSGSVSSASVERLLGTFVSTRQINISNKMCPQKDGKRNVCHRII